MDQAYERPFQPTSIALGTLKAFPVAEMVKQLGKEAAFRESGRDALTLVHDANLTIVLTVARTGTACGRHKDPGPAAIIVLSGTILVSSPEAAEPMEANPGSMIAIGPGVGHVVEAKSDAAFLTVIGRQANAKT